MVGASPSVNRGIGPRSDLCPWMLISVACDNWTRLPQNLTVKACFPPACFNLSESILRFLDPNSQGTHSRPLSVDVVQTSRSRILGLGRATTRMVISCVNSSPPRPRCTSAFLINLVAEHGMCLRQDFLYRLLTPALQSNDQALPFRAPLFLQNFRSGKLDLLFAIDGGLSDSLIISGIDYYSRGSLLRLSRLCYNTLHDLYISKIGALSDTTSEHRIFPSLSSKRS